jgi:hypothetical protein
MTGMSVAKQDIEKETSKLFFKFETLIDRGFA